MEKIVKIRQPVERTLNDLCLKIPQWKEEGVRTVFLEMADVHAMDTTTISQLVSVALVARQEGLRFNLYKLQPGVRRELLTSSAGILLGIREDGPPSFETIM